MKRYIKDGIIKFGNEIVIRRDKMQTINPSEEMILADGWVEYIIPEPTEEEKFDRAKRDLRVRIEHHDTSFEVNGFYMKGTEIWLDKSTRAGLMLRLHAEQAIGKESTTLWYGSNQFELSLEQAFQMLYALEVYASQCYDNTQRHLANVNALQTIEEVEAYDYRVGYPEKLNF